MRSDSDAVTTRMVAGEVNNTTQPSEPLISEKGGTEHAIPWKDIGRTLGCVFLSTLACLTVNPAVPLGWHLRFSGQIVVIGFLLTLMLQFIVSDMVKSAFLLYEFRFGRRNKKSYRAILTEDILTARKGWWPIIGLWSLVPIVLSAGYKQFLGGEASRRWDSGFDSSMRKYGVDFPRIGDWSPPNDSIYLLLTSFAPFQTASDHGKADYPTDFPRPYGYNTLLLGNDSAAILDLPIGAYMAALQHELTQSGDGSYFIIEADVDAYVATRNTSTPDFVADDDLWEAAFARRWPETGLTTMSLYKTDQEAFGILPFGDPTTSDNNRMFVGLYYNSTQGRGMFSYETLDEPELVPFRRNAQLYNIGRQTCHGRWQLNDTSILLLHGTCDGRTADSDVLNISTTMGPFAYDAVPPLIHTYEHLIRTGPESSWLRPTYCVSVATIYWARALYMFGRGVPFEAYYRSGETIDWVRPTLRADPVLYFILCFPSLVAVTALIFLWLVGRVPEGQEPWMEDDIVKEALAERIERPRTSSQN